MNPPSSLPYPQNPNPNFFLHPAPQNPNSSFFFQPPQGANHNFAQSSALPPPSPQSRNANFAQSPALPPPSPQNTNPNFGQSSIPHPPTVRDPSAALSSLKSLISRSQKTLDSLSQTLSVDPQFLVQKVKDVNLIHCPFNPHHRMPPEALFLHSLRCPRPLDLTHLLSSLNYPNDLKPSCELIGDPTGDDLCFSVDSQANSWPNFCYEGCPGVVDISDLDRKKKRFILPGVLSAECGDFIGSNEKEVKGIKENRFRILPADLWAIRNEIDAWRDFPSSYPFNVLCAVLGSKLVGESDMKNWVIVNSPRYGVIIDAYMRDHIFLLFRLCLKSILKEACSLVEFAANAEDLKGNEQRASLKNRRFECPVLVQVLTWLASQFVVLYGEGNGRFLAINMFKQCVSESASQILSFHLEEKMIKTPERADVSEGSDGTSIDLKDVKLEEPLESRAGSNSGKNSVENDGTIYVSWVAAAVAALHERSLLEEKIKALRFSQPLTRYQRHVEHDMVTRKADEERKRRPNYRPVIDHDGLPRQQSSNEETNKTKTREELLAEERDYKRRRMSYRGKKVKRTPLQVLRDIIEEYTEEIKLAGGIGSFEKPAEKETTESKLSLGEDQKETRYDFSTSSTISEDASPKVYKQPKRVHYGDHEYSTDRRRRNDRDKYGTGYDSGGSGRRPSHGRSYEQNDDGRDLDDSDFTRTMGYRMKKRLSNQDRRQSYHVKGSAEDKRGKYTYDDNSSGFSRKYAFNDRYDPSERQ